MLLSTNRHKNLDISWILGCIQRSKRLSCFIFGHFITADYRYKNPKEGTLVAGNSGHWLGSVIRLVFCSQARMNPINISIAYSDKTIPSDNFCASSCTPRGDLVILTFSPGSEPFEGVNEAENFYREMTSLKSTTTGILKYGLMTGI